jgi:hypothetical protein
MRYFYCSIGTRSVILNGLRIVNKRGEFVVVIVGESSHVLIEAVSMSGQASAECVCE